MLLSICNSIPLLRKHEKTYFNEYSKFPSFIQQNHSTSMFFGCFFEFFDVSQTIKSKKAHLIHGLTVAVMCDESLFPVVRLQTLFASLGTRNANKETLQRSRPNNSSLHY